jgi:hypothetical protein
MFDGESDRSAAPVVGTLLLVGVVVAIGTVVVLISFTFLANTGTPTADAAFEYQQTPAGLRMAPQALGTDVVVKLNGQQITTFAEDSAGEWVLLPTAPGDRITVVSQDKKRSVLVTRRIDGRDEVRLYYAAFSEEEVKLLSKAMGS